MTAATQTSRSLRDLLVLRGSPTQTRVPSSLIPGARPLRRADRELGANGGERLRGGGDYPTRAFRRPRVDRVALHARRRSMSFAVGVGQRSASLPASVELLMLGQIVGDLEPRRLRADEDVLGRSDRRSIFERAHRHVHESAVADDGEQERSACSATAVVRVRFAVDQQRLLPGGDGELVSGSMPANDLKAVPVAARHREQWQFAEYRNASSTSY